MDKLVRKPGIPQKILGGSLAGELEYVDSLRPAKRSDVTVGRQPPGPGEQQSGKLRISQNIAVSCVSAWLAHVPHHPLYRLKTQMMFHGKRFRLRNFLTMAWESRGTFLMRGIYIARIIQEPLHFTAMPSVMLQVSWYDPLESLQKRLSKWWPGTEECTLPTMHTLSARRVSSGHLEEP